METTTENVIPVPPTGLIYVPKTDDEIRQLALDTFHQKIFWSTLIPPDDAHMMTAIFMTTMFMNEEQIKSLVDYKAVMYEYLDKASPRSVNGYPAFFSFSFVVPDDYNKIVTKLKAIEAAVNNA